jgi:hypothetical protein
MYIMKYTVYNSTRQYLKPPPKTHNRLERWWLPVAGVCLADRECSVLLWDAVAVGRVGPILFCIRTQLTDVHVPRHMCAYIYIIQQIQIRLSCASNSTAMANEEEGIFK